MDNDKKTALMLFLQSFVGFFIKLGLGFFLARHLSEAAFGDYNLAIKMLALLTVVTIYGTNTSINRYLAKYLNTQQRETAAKYVAWNRKLVYCTTLISLLVAFFSVVLIQLLDMIGIKSFDDYHLASYVVWVAPIAAFLGIFSSFMIVRGYNLRAGFNKKVLVYLTQLVLFGLAVYFFDSSLTNQDIIAVLALSLIFCFMVARVSIGKELQEISLESFAYSKSIKVREEKWFKSSNRFIINNIFLSLTCAIELLMIEFLSPFESDVGFYSAALMLTGIFWLVPSSVYQSLQPKISQLIDGHETRITLQKIINQLNIVNFAILLLLALSILFFETDLLLLFGPSYLKAKNILGVLLSGVVISCAARPAVLLLVLGGEEKLVLKASCLEFLVLFVLLIPATHYYGMMGTAAITCLVLILKAAYFVMMVRKKFSLKSMTIV